MAASDLARMGVIYAHSGSFDDADRYVRRDACEMAAVACESIMRAASDFHWWLNAQSA